MLRLESNLTPWSDEAAQMLAPIFKGDKTGGVDNVKRQVLSGNASLHRVSKGTDLVGFFSVRIDQFAAGDEMVIIAAAGALHGVPLLHVFLPLLEANAKGAGCESVRIHTSRKGMFKQLAKRGYQFSEWILRKPLT